MCWELGGGLGHLTKGRLLAQALTAQGCQVAFVVKDVASGDAVLPDEWPLFQTPQAPTLRGWPDPADHAELLLHAGLGDAAGLQGRVRSWADLMAMAGTDCVLADHAPTAVLAARCTNRPVVLFGNGFVMPPRPWPLVRHWEAVPAARLQQVREHLRQVINSVLERFDQPGLDTLEDFYEGCTLALATSPDLDHHPRPPLRPSDWQLGPLLLDSEGQPPAWPAHEGPRVFAYLRPNLPHLDLALQALGSLDAAVLVRCDGLAPALMQRFQSPRLSFTGELVRMADVAEQASLVVCSGSDTAHGLAARGVPVMALPMNAEQRLAAERLVALGVGRMWLPAAEKPDTLRQDMHALLQPDARRAAEILQARHRSMGTGTAALEALAAALVARHGADRQ